MNREHLDILKQGVKAWNQWRKEHPFVDGFKLEPNLSHADLRGANLEGADLSEANLSSAHLERANLHRTNLEGADLSEANLEGADLSDTNLTYVNFSYANLSAANLSAAYTGYTVFAGVDLSSVKGLVTIGHWAASTISIDTIIKSQSKLTKGFLLGCGVPDSFIEAIPWLIGSLSPIDYYSCFISYSSKDEAFARRLYESLQSNHVRCWFAPEDMKIGDRIRPRIDESIRMYDRLLLVLSEHSVSSKWVEFEVEAAMDKEQEGKPSVLFPVRLDNTVIESTTAWAAHIKRTRHIGDFTNWKNHDDYQKAFSRLLRDLKAEAQKMGSREGTTNGD